MEEQVIQKKDFNQEEYVDKGKEIISRTREVRNEISRYQQKISSADFRLSMSPNDAMWTQKRDEDLQELKALQDEETVLKNELFALESFIDEDYYKLLLQEYGNTLAETSSVQHISNNLHDEYDLSKALYETEKAIFIKAKEFEEAVNNNDKKNAVITSAQIRFYRTDMKKHHWGVDRLAAIDDRLVKKGNSR